MSTTYSNIQLMKIKKIKKIMFYITILLLTFIIIYGKINSQNAKGA